MPISMWKEWQIVCDCCYSGTGYAFYDTRAQTIQMLRKEHNYRLVDGKWYCPGCYNIYKQTNPHLNPDFSEVGGPRRCAMQRLFYLQKPLHTYAYRGNKEARTTTRVMLSACGKIGCRQG